MRICTEQRIATQIHRFHEKFFIMMFAQDKTYHRNNSNNIFNMFVLILLQCQFDI